MHLNAQITRQITNLPCQAREAGRQSFQRSGNTRAHWGSQLYSQVLCAATAREGLPGPDDIAVGSSVRSYVLDMRADVLTGALAVLHPEERVRLDESEDSEFYSAPRLVHHADEHFRASLTGLYAQLLQPYTCVLDLCSSWDSHLPPGLKLAGVVGHGMNLQELRRNTRLTSSFVRDLNAHPQLGDRVQEGSLGAVVCASGIQYLTRPEWVLAEALKALQPGGVLVVSFSSHCFESKATSAWLQRDSQQRLDLVGDVARAVGFEQVRFVAMVPSSGNHLDAIEVPQQAAGRSITLHESTDAAWANAIAFGNFPDTTAFGAQQGVAQAARDPLFAVVAYKPLRPSGVAGMVLPFPGSAELRHKATSSASSSTGGPSEPGFNTPEPASALEGMDLQAPTPADVAANFVAPALLELDLRWGPSTRSSSNPSTSTASQGASEGTQPGPGGLNQGGAGAEQPGVPGDSTQGRAGGMDEAGQEGARQNSTQQPALVLLRKQQQDQQETPGTETTHPAIPHSPGMQGVPAGGAPVSPAPEVQVGEATLQRWRIAYAAMSHDAQALGVPASAIPPLPPNAGAKEIRDARDHLQALLASFLSAGL